LVGCASSQLRVPSWQSQRTLMLKSRGVLPPSDAKPSEQDIAERQKYLDKLEKSHEDINALARKTLGHLKRQANNNSKLTLATGGVGIASGIAAGALVVASPANAVWVAALTGVGAGALSFQTRAALEGFSRDAVARVYNDTITRMAAADTQYQASYQELVANKTTWTDAKWDEVAGAAEVSLQKYRSAATLVALPSGTEEVETLKQRNVELTSQLDQLQKQLDKIKKDNNLK